MKQYPNLTSATIIKDSINMRGNRITTIKMVFPRYILAELNTHRMFNRNSASSRAIPFKKMLEAVEENPFVPMAWQKHHKGMQGSSYWTSEEANDAYNTNKWIEGYTAVEVHERNWLQARDEAINMAQILYDGGVTKQLVNRLLEPFMYHTALITATEWENFFELRCPKYEVPGVSIEEDGELVDIPSEYFKSKKDLLKRFPHLENTYHTTEDWLTINRGAGEIHIMDLAEKVWDAMNESTPEKLSDGAFHIPFMDKESELAIMAITPKPPMQHPEEDTAPLESMWYSDVLDNMLKVSVARAARISYETLGDNPKIDYETDIKLHDDLLSMKHMSPFEHCARAMYAGEYSQHIKTSDFDTDTLDVEDEDSNLLYISGYLKEDDLGWSRNLHGFVQYREIVEQINN
jgi:hypothetical protein